MSVISKACRGLLCGAALTLSAPSMAQNTTTADNVAVDDGFNPNANAPVYDRTVTTTQTKDHDTDIPWGLLGLLGLAGLMGRKRHDDVSDINVDARRDKRP